MPSGGLIDIHAVLDEEFHFVELIAVHSTPKFPLQHLFATVAVAYALKPRTTFLLTKPIGEEQFQHFDGRAGVVESLTIVGIEPASSSRRTRESRCC
jgi:hypothetical protein